ncbi:MAG TPA: adenylosuccinate lyase [Spirochaetota bacterium]|nr:adenylosuccinate lyase [Spirochaetota bacterium]HOL55985.1 adenylosuccinate lyase [Spirochaetota bacterium]HPP03427.1 adenylosuccinate lyase [Spirochaetota bacterium]
MSIDFFINAISPIDGRYYEKTKELKDFFSEKSLFSYRIYVETQYLIKLIETRELNIRKITDKEKEILENLHKISDEDCRIIKEIETKGYKEIPATNHDVKAVEYFIKLKLDESSLKDIKEFVHFALTSEDINNIAYGLIIRDSINEKIFPLLIDCYAKIYEISIKYKDLPMLARTHGQPASPTTFGKEMLVFVKRLKDEFLNLYNQTILLKLNGATGNFNAHNICYPEIDWIEFSKDFIFSFEKEKKTIQNEHYSKLPLKVDFNLVTTQIEPHDSYCRIFDSFKRINTILIDFCMDIWRYISDGWLKQKAIKGEIGSSAMPHKVNPIDFENAEGNLGVANSLFNFFSSKLMISRLQRDLSDSTVLRNIGAAFAYSFLAYKSIIKGLSKIEVDQKKILEELNNTPEILAEAYQNVLRKIGFDKPYELLKEITRGKKIALDDFHNLIKNLNIDNETKNRLLSLKPFDYIGLASRIVEKFDKFIQ